MALIAQSIPVEGLVDFMGMKMKTPVFSLLRSIQAYPLSVVKPGVGGNCRSGP